MRLKDIQQQFHNELDSIYGKNEVDSFFSLLIAHYFNLKSIQLVLNPETSIHQKEQNDIYNALDDLKKEIPIQYIIGETEFYGLPFKVNNKVLIPRPETEELVSWIFDSVKKNKPLNILDIGTGSGCVAISLSKIIKNAKVFALDISLEALEVAKENAALNNVDIEFIEYDILRSDKTIDQKFDIIVSNPPYVRLKEKEQMKANVLLNEPELALFVTDENPLLFYESIASFAQTHLNKKGMLFFEINAYLGDEMMQLMRSHQFKNTELKQDIFEKDRMLKGMIQQ